MQVFKTKAEVGAWLNQWDADNLAEANLENKAIFKACFTQLEQFNGKQLLKHITKGAKGTQQGFCQDYTGNANHGLCSILYIDLCEWLGAGKW